MAKKAATPKAIDLDAEVKKALLTIATADGPMRFAKKAGGNPSLFAGPGGAEAKRVIPACTTGDDPLTKIVGKDKEEKIALTLAGVTKVFDTLLASNPPAPTLIRVLDDVMNGLPDADRAEKLSGFVKRGALKMPAEARIEYLRDESRLGLIPAEQLDELLTSAEAEAAEARREAARKKKAADEEYLRCLEVAKQSILREQQGEVELLKELLKMAGWTAELDRFEPITLPFPTDGNVNELRQAYADIIAGIWYHNASRGNRELEQGFRNVLRNVGNIAMVGDPGEEVAFEPVYHECKSGGVTGQPMRVVYSGWVLNEAGGEYVIRKAIVEKVS